ncbi:hypothetical protein, partial [Acinetobacter baumannii]|uniref:hypothetical protein n=1 Tax=Acinetobacter baumannii TaxID=470 RepID=UPI001C0762A2
AVRVLNPGNDPVTLRKGATVGLVTPITEDDILEPERSNTTDHDVGKVNIDALPSHLEDLYEESTEHLEEAECQKIKEWLIK